MSESSWHDDVLDDVLDTVLDDVFAALANPIRRSMVRQLASGAATVSELAEPLEVSMPSVSRHLRVLEHAGLVTQTREGQFRPCHLQSEPLQQVAGWVETYRHVWADRLDNMADYLASLDPPAAATSPAVPNIELQPPERTT